MNYNNSSTTYNDDFRKIYLTSYDWNKYCQIMQQEPVTVYRPSWDQEYKTIWGYQSNKPKYEIDFDYYEAFRNDRLNKIDKKKAELLSWINDKESV